MSNTVFITDRDRAILRLLEMTPATAHHVLKFSVSLPGEPFREERRVRERLQALAGAGFVQSFPLAISGGGRSQYYRLTGSGFRATNPDLKSTIPRPAISPVAPSRVVHAMATADIIVQTLVACHKSGVHVAQFHGDGRLALTVGQYRQEPDCHFQFEAEGKSFNVLFEIDNGTEPLESPREQSIRSKILAYEAYQDWVLELWKKSSLKSPDPRFRVVFLTVGETRAMHILRLAKSCARNRDRRLFLAATQSVFLTANDPICTSILLDHHEHPQSLVSSALFNRGKQASIRLTDTVALDAPVC